MKTDLSRERPAFIVFQQSAADKEKERNEKFLLKMPFMAAETDFCQSPILKAF
jgi:hypothetical protein